MLSPRICADETSTIAGAAGHESANVERRVNRSFACAAMLAVCLILSMQTSVMATPTVANFTLQNGLEVVVVPDHRTPVVTHMLWYRVGAADETAGKSGIAHFLEHLMFKGTAKN